MGRIRGKCLSKPGFSRAEVPLIELEQPEVERGPGEVRVELERFEERFPSGCAIALVHQHRSKIEMGRTKVGPQRDRFSKRLLCLIEMTSLQLKEGGAILGAKIVGLAPCRLVSQIRRDGKLPVVLGLLCEGHEPFGVVALTTSCREGNEAQPQSISPRPNLQYHESIPIRRKF